MGPKWKTKQTNTLERSEQVIRWRRGEAMDEERKAETSSMQHRNKEGFHSAEINIMPHKTRFSEPLKNVTSNYINLNRFRLRFWSLFIAISQDNFSS